MNREDLENKEDLENREDLEKREIEEKEGQMLAQNLDTQAIAETEQAQQQQGIKRSVGRFGDN
eukprot:SAG22_NODE_210_length_15092_cov_81.740946_7_plen_63_part_00